MDIEELKKVYFLDGKGELYKNIPKSRRREGGPIKVVFKPNDKNGYCVLTFKGHKIKSHRLVMFLYLNRILTSTEQVDHKDGDKLNNVPSNLRVVSNRLNCSNKETHRNGKLVGTKKTKNGYSSQLRINKDNVYLGVYPTNLEAHEMYNKALKNKQKYTGNGKEFRQLLGYTEKRNR